MYIDETVFKQIGSPILFTLYLVSLKTRKLDWVFDVAALSMLASAPTYLFTRILGVNLLGFITSLWKTWATPAIYLAFTILTYATTYVKTKDTPYALTLACHMTLSTGYLYEAPRYLYLQGLKGMIRFNKLSLFYVDYAIVSLVLIVWLLNVKKVRVNNIILVGVLGYIIYFLVFYLGYQWLHEIRFIHVMGYVIPWINLYRLPSMLMFYITVKHGGMS